MNTNKQTARIIEDVQIKLSALWVALTFIWQQGDALRLYSGGSQLDIDVNKLKTTHTILIETAV